MMNGNALSLHFSPLIDPSWLTVFVVIAAGLFVVAALRNRSFLIWRALAVGAFLTVLANPSIIEEERNAVRDILAVVVDQSPSQTLGKREEVQHEALGELIQKLELEETLDVRLVYAPQESNFSDKETALFTALNTAMADTPDSRRAGVIILSDGQVHDVPDNLEDLNYGPIHTLLTGDPNERDRQIKITQSPAYGLVGDTITIKYVVSDTDNINDPRAMVRLRWGGGEERTEFVTPGTENKLTLPIENAGQNIFEIEVETVNGELSEANNKTALIVNGVRDRLKVLLVSGQPHNGGRTWRDMLTSDPGVDLVHFTILREPDKLDSTPQRELSLIAFPFRELFEFKLYDFDLIIFDRYRLNYILPTYYFANIARYVKEGGALLEASGPAFSTEFSIYNTELNEILPGKPTGQVRENPYKPHLTTIGLNHPVTMDFQNMEANWGSWLRQVSITPTDGDVVMAGEGEQPLMVLSRVGKGRVAQIASDQIWLWSRGYDGGGPHRELLRRTAHWLMKEPELDENALEATLSKSDILIRRRSLHDNELEIEVEKPDGDKETVTLSRDSDVGWLSARMPLDQTGIYSFSDGQSSHFVVSGSLGSKEMAGVIATDEIMEPVAEASGGSVRWLSSGGAPDIRVLPQGRKYSGAGWIGLRQNNDYTVSGVQDRALLPAWLALLLLMSLSVWMWWREGKAN